MLQMKIVGFCPFATINPSCLRASDVEIESGGNDRNQCPADTVLPEEASSVCGEKKQE